MPRAIHPGLTVEEVTRRFPGTACAFLDHRMACLGCAMAPFDTLGDAAAVYGLDPGAFVRELSRCARPPEAGRRPERKRTNTTRKETTR